MWNFSINKIIQDAFNSFKRFPLVLFLAFSATIVSIYLIGKSNDFHNYYLENYIHTAFLGLSIMLSAAILTEHYKIPGGKIGLRVVVLALLAAYYFYLPAQELHETYWIRFVLFFLASHLFVSFSPFLIKSELFGFWEFNKRLFINLLTSALYSAALFIGLSLAIVAVEQLFGFEFDGKIYPQLWVFMVGVFNTWFFLSKFPKNYSELDENLDYPKGLLLFTQYVLLPLVSIYLLILYAYEAKIIINWELPVGWVSYLVIGFSVAGILALLLVYPLQDKENYPWIRNFTKWFYWAVFPLIVLLFIAIGKRVFDYGITENRYFVLILAFWLLIVAIYLLVNKLRNVKIIPVSLAIVIFLSSFGPWGVFSVSKNSQLGRLNKIFQEKNYLNNELLFQKGDTLKMDEYSEIASIVDYLAEMHGIETFQPYFKKNIYQIVDTSLSRYAYGNQILEEMEFSDYMSVSVSDSVFYIMSDLSDLKLKNIEGYSYFLNKNFYRIDSIFEEYDHLILKKYNSNLQFIASNDTVNFNLDEIIESILKKHGKDATLAREKLMFVEENTNFKIKLIIDNASGDIKPDEIEINSMMVDILIAFKNNEN